MSREEISEIIGNAPGWLLRSGISILALITVMLLGLSHMISYPDKLVGRGYITTEIPPVEMRSQRSGVIDLLYVSDQDQVIEEQALLYYKNPAIKEHVDQYSSWIEQAKTGDVAKLSKDYELGSLQPSYAQLVLLIDEYLEVLSHQSAGRQINTIQDELANIHTLNQSIQVEEEHYQAEKEILQGELDRAKKLYAEGLISKVQLEQEEKKLEQFARQQQMTAKNTIQNQIRSDQLRLEAQQIAEERSTQIRNYRFQINQLVSAIEAEIKAWDEQYVLRAESAGTVEWTELTIAKNTINQSDLLGYIVPHQDQQKVLKANISAEGIGKIDIGSSCIIKLDNYPYKEYGIISAQVNTISQLPNVSDSGPAYGLTCSLPDVLSTDSNYSIPYTPNMTSTIEVISEDKSVLSRITEQLTDLIRKS